MISGHDSRFPLPCHFYLNAENRTWTVVDLQDLQHFMADLDRRHLEPSSRNRKAYNWLGQGFATHISGQKSGRANRLFRFSVVSTASHYLTNV